MTNYNGQCVGKLNCENVKQLQTENKKAKRFLRDMLPFMPRENYFQKNLYAKVRAFLKP